MRSYGEFVTRGGEGSCAIYLIIPKVLHTDIHTDIHTDPPMKQVLEELSLLKISPRENFDFHCCMGR